MFLIVFYIQLYSLMYVFNKYFQDNNNINCFNNFFIVAFHFKDFWMNRGQFYFVYFTLLNFVWIFYYCCLSHHSFLCLKSITNSIAIDVITLWFMILIVWGLLWNVIVMTRNFLDKILNKWNFLAHFLYFVE